MSRRSQRQSLLPLPNLRAKLRRCFRKDQLGPSQATGGRPFSLVNLALLKLSGANVLEIIVRPYYLNKF